MCGLLFHFDPAHAPERGQRLIRNALTKLMHRGPDELRTLNVKQAHFAHARLSIIDLSGSHQPMQSPNERYTIVYNGEIYNYKKLRKRLASRWNFVTTGDTEVLLAGLVLDGENFLSELDGMWAFAFWDALEQRLFLSRDRIGKKPLYYFQEGKHFSCGSELPALQALSSQPWSEDIDSTADYFRFGYYLPGFTAWSDVFEVLPGHFLTWTPGKNVEQKAYWQLPCPNATSQPSSDSLSQALYDAVEKRLIADVEVGAFLSGGVDSSLICAIAQEKMDRPLKTYTIKFSEASHDESSYAATVANYLKTDHHCEAFEQHHLSQTKLLHEHIGQPFADTSLLPTAVLSQAAAKDVKVVLSGDGADELFGGYQRYQARLLLRWYTRLPKRLRWLVARTIRSLPEPTAHHSRSLLKKAHLFLDIVEHHGIQAPYIAPAMFHPDEYSRLFPDLVGRGHTPPGLPEEAAMDDLQRMMCSDALVYLPQDVMTKVDRASMAFSLEARSPFLDHKVIELAFATSASAHVRLGSGKRMLSSTFKDALPKSIWKRRKQGFLPPNPSPGKMVQDVLNKDAIRCCDVINHSAVKKMLSQHQSASRDHGMRIHLIRSYLEFFAR